MGGRGLGGCNWWERAGGRTEGETPAADGVPEAGCCWNLLSCYVEGLASIMVAHVYVLLLQQTDLHWRNSAQAPAWMLPVGSTFWNVSPFPPMWRAFITGTNLRTSRGLIPPFLPWDVFTATNEELCPLIPTANPIPKVLPSTPKHVTRHVASSMIL